MMTAPQRENHNKVVKRSLHTPRSDRSRKGCGWALWALTLCEQEECLTRALRSDGLFFVFRVVICQIQSRVSHDMVSSHVLFDNYSEKLKKDIF